MVEVAAADDRTTFAIQELLAARWATAPADRTVREPGEAYGCAATWTCGRKPTQPDPGRYRHRAATQPTDHRPITDITPKNRPSIPIDIQTTPRSRALPTILAILVDAFVVSHR
ncbi:DUF6207 family protein [Streptomyces sp. enrichment culture]|uniref:DUF6207 family protein n=1 Tax=Streptomyces sp. enrichment culture TaxID=1795815 RepID=UPI003F571B0B